MLPRGIAAAGAWHRSAWLRPLSGCDEAFLCEEGRYLLPARRTTALLARTLDRLGPLRPVEPEAVRALTIGDRNALLFHLRRITFGERIACVLSCPDRACGEKMDVGLDIGD